MRYLSAYTLFETVSEDEMIADIKDMLLELSDMGYSTNVNKIHTEIQINITKPSEDSEMNAGFRFLPLWNTEDDKIEFDDVILRVLGYAVGKGYKYNYEGIKSAVESIKGQVVNYSIRLSK